MFPLCVITAHGIRLDSPSTTAVAKIPILEIENCRRGFLLTAGPATTGVRLTVGSGASLRWSWATAWRHPASSFWKR